MELHKVSVQFRRGEKGQANSIRSPQIDRFSKLPPELIDSIFEIAVSRDKSSTIAPSKALSTSHARALYRRIHISEHHQLEKLAASLVANPNNGLHVRSIVWCDNMLYEGGTSECDWNYSARYWRNYQI